MLMRKEQITMNNLVLNKNMYLFLVLKIRAVWVSIGLMKLPKMAGLELKEYGKN